MWDRVLSTFSERLAKLPKSTASTLIQGLSSIDGLVAHADPKRIISLYAVAKEVGCLDAFERLLVQHWEQSPDARCWDALSPMMATGFALFDRPRPLRSDCSTDRGRAAADAAVHCLLDAMLKQNLVTPSNPSPEQRAALFRVFA